ncbi:MAG: hypothetical protein KF856_07980 [Cyclobacteriaceae bacterium]|nr:hypothetical protein [Cyclobacteriaceae bacterium]
MKKLIFLVFLMSALSCTEQELVNRDIPEILLQFKKSSQFNAIDGSFAELKSNLSFEKFWNEDFNGTKVYAIPSEVSGKITGVIYVDNFFNTLIEIRSFTKTDLTISYKLTDGTLILDWTGIKLGDQYKFNYNDLIDSYSKLSSNSRINSCTGDCYAALKEACNSDNDCAMMCDLVPTCNLSIAVACFWACW